MATPQDYIVFCNNVYNQAPIYSLPPNWRLNNNSSRHGFIGVGYYGQCYVNDTTKEIVFAHRGSIISWMSFLSDWAIFQKHIPKEYYKARWFIAESLVNLPIDYTISQTGHSLGAVLAELCAVSENQQSVTFDCPGSYPLLRTLITRGLLKENTLYSAKQSCKIYVSAPNIVNTCNRQIADTYKITNNTQLPTSFLNYLLPYTLKQHSTINFYSAVQNNIIPQQVTYPTGLIKGYKWALHRY